MPVFLALLHVLRYFNRPGLGFEQNAAIPNYVFGPDEVRSFLEARLFGAPLSSYIVMPQSLLDSFGAHVQRWEVVAVYDVPADRGGHTILPVRVQPGSFEPR
jgi:YidC/Oxa1 family membrane protein insertase